MMTVPALPALTNSQAWFLNFNASVGQQDYTNIGKRTFRGFTLNNMYPAMDNMKPSA